MRKAKDTIPVSAESLTTCACGIGRDVHLKCDCPLLPVFSDEAAVEFVEEEITNVVTPVKQ